MSRPKLLGIIGCALALAPAACATSQFDRHFEAGQYTEASRLFSQDSALQRQEKALFRTGLVYALPASPVYHPMQAREIFERLLTIYPKTAYRNDIAFLTSLLDEVQRLERTADERGVELERLRHRLSEVEERARWLETLLQRQELQSNSFRELAERLEEELRETRAQLGTLQDEMERLKEIDLKARPRPGTGAAQGSTRS